MWVSKKEIEDLSERLKSYSSGEQIDIRDNREGAFSILKNDIYAILNAQNEQLINLEKQRNVLAEYMADISHQLKTPITSMNIMTELLEVAEPEKQQEFIRNIKFSLNKMEWLVGTLLKMTKIDAGALTFSMKPVKVSEICEKVLPAVSILVDIKEQSIEIIHDCVIDCDAGWTAEALLNIVKNAIEHSPEGGKIVIDSGSNAMYQWISVKDCGVGMDKSMYAAMFQRFKYSTNDNGFGIGLPFALSIMRGQGGDIDMDFGEHGQGTLVRLKFFQ
ncbi:MAG: HAMP domain-containing histidine kinase [Acetatifactor sp.]|nr:HAMP domain-containing histidine kinase [Acetatifactor sp.]